jgi:ribonuclease BN (tRNA processing enzyme)
MEKLVIRFFGSGDAFGSGGRLQSCIMVDTGGPGILIDCGATALSGMKRHGFDSSRIETILISHLHGDHFGGLPFLIKEIQVSDTRQAPLLIAGPEGLEAATLELLGLLFPGREDVRSGFWPEFVTLSPGKRASLGGIEVAAYPAAHAPLARPLSLRIECLGRIVAYSGDTAWSEELPEVCRGADLFICESSEYDREAGGHLDYLTILEHQGELDCRRIILTHLGEAMLARCGSLELECARDGASLII